MWKIQLDRVGSPDIVVQLIAVLLQVLEHSFVFLFFWVGKMRGKLFTKAKSQKNRFDTVYAFVMIRIYIE